MSYETVRGELQKNGSYELSSGMMLFPALGGFLSSIIYVLSFTGLMDKELPRSLEGFIASTVIAAASIYYLVKGSKYAHKMRYSPAHFEYNTLKDTVRYGADAFIEEYRTFKSFQEE